MISNTDWCFVFQNLFAYDFKEEYTENGWEVYDHVAEFKRQVRDHHVWALHQNMALILDRICFYAKNKEKS